MITQLTLLFFLIKDKIDETPGEAYTFYEDGRLEKE